VVEIEHTSIKSIYGVISSTVVLLKTVSFKSHFTLYACTQCIIEQNSSTECHSCTRHKHKRYLTVVEEFFFIQQALVTNIHFTSGWHC